MYGIIVGIKFSSIDSDINWVNYHGKISHSIHTVLGRNRFFAFESLKEIRVSCVGSHSIYINTDSDKQNDYSYVEKAIEALVKNEVTNFYLNDICIHVLKVDEIKDLTHEIREHRTGIEWECSSDALKRRIENFERIKKSFNDTDNLLYIEYIDIHINVLYKMIELQKSGDVEGFNKLYSSLRNGKHTRELYETLFEFFNV